jgi:integrase
MTQRITEKLVAQLKPGQAIYDSDITGFTIRRQSKNSIFEYKYRFNGRQRRVRIGKHGDRCKLWVRGQLVRDGDPANWDVDRARTEAKRLQGLVAIGVDPAEERQGAKQAPTVADLARDYMERKACDKRTCGEDQRKIDRDIIPLLGSRKVKDVTRRDIEDIRHAKRESPYAANRVLSLLSRMFNVAVGWGWRPDNPVKGVERFPESSSERFLSQAELARLSDALSAHPEQQSVNAIRLLMLTGARKSEVLTAKWVHFDLSTGVWIKPSAHTKTKREHRVPLNAPALKLLADIMAKAEPTSPYVFPRKVASKGPKDTEPTPANAAEPKPQRDIKRTWANVCREAEVKDVRIHDLRHTYASILASRGQSLAIIGKLLGHTKLSTTMKYAKLYDEPLKEATEQVGAVMREIEEMREQVETSDPRKPMHELLWLRPARQGAD